jgi:ribosome-associated toxin RatA of RatAB toxin-antitoxin module
MPDATSSTISITAAAPAVLAVIADFAAYPQWVTGVQEARVLSTTVDGRAEQVHFVLDAAPIKDEYTLEYVWDGDRAVHWHLVEGKVLTALEGTYELRERNGQTEVTYRLEVDVGMPLIGMLKRKAEKVIIDAALRGLKARVESSR